MDKPCIVCIDDEASSLDTLRHVLQVGFGDTHDIFCFASSQEAFREIHSLANAGRDLTLVVYGLDPGRPSEDSLMEYVDERYPQAMKLLMVGPASKSEQPGALEQKTSHLESLHQVGVALAGSFDIDSILRQIAHAASRLVGDVPIEVFYAGSRTINSKPRWLPASSADGYLSPASRRQITDEVSGISEKGSESGAAATASLEQFLHRLPDGAHRHLIPLRGNGELLGLMIFESKDELDREGLELLAILRLQAATALRNIHLTQERIHFERLSAFGQMIGSLVHDFRSPLTAVRGYAGMLAGVDLKAHERQEYSELAIEECDRLNTMIDELLEFTRGGRSEPDLELMSIGDFLQNLVPAIQAHFEGSPVEFELNLGYDGPTLLDPNRMKRAVLNVVSNAGQAMHGGGAFTIQTEQQGDRLILEFQDSGCGIPEDIHHRIFDPFFSHGKPQGIGLGMSITRKIVEQHGGRIELASEVGRGTRVRFVLPLDAGNREPAKSGTQEVKASSSF